MGAPVNSVSRRELCNIPSKAVAMIHLYTLRADSTDIFLDFGLTHLYQLAHGHERKNQVTQSLKNQKAPIFSRAFGAGSAPSARSQILGGTHPTSPDSRGYAIPGGMEYRLITVNGVNGAGSQLLA